MKCAIFPGSFDPITLGHEDLICRALPMFDKLVVAVSNNRRKGKYLFDIQERVELAKTVLTKQIARSQGALEVNSYEGVMVEYAKKVGASIIMRGVRIVTDLSYELQMCGMNRKLAPELETLLLAADSQYTNISSTLVCEIASHHGDVSKFVRPPVAAALQKKFA